MQKKKVTGGGFYYSTNPEAYELPESEVAVTLPPDQQKLMVKLDSKQRAGKVVTLVDGFSGQLNDLELLGKQLKTKCGTGGSVKDGQILLQGDYKAKVILLLQQLNYKVISK